METVAGEVEKLGAEVLTVPTDVTDEEQVRSLMRQVHRRWGRIDVLVNNAGIVSHFHVGSPRWSRIRDMDKGFFEQVMNTNLGGTFLCTKHALPYMESLNAGHVINFGQGSLRVPANPGRPNIGTCVYSTSKLAIRAFTRFVAAEEREFNICILSMGPGGPGERPRETGPGIAGGGGGIVTDDSPDWAKELGRGMWIEEVGDRYVVAAEAPMEFSGHQVMVKDGRLEIAAD